MQIILISNLLKKNHIIIKKSQKNILPKRTMFSRIAKTRSVLSENLTLTFNQRWAGQYRLFRWKKDISLDEQRRLGLTPHECTHDNIQDTTTGKIEGLLTSAQNKDGNSPAIYDKISSVKCNGSFTPLKDSKTKQSILDKEGNPIPDPNKGGQYMATYPTPRKVYPDTDYLRKINKTGQQYVDKYETDIQANINKNRKFYRPKASKNIGGIDEE
jgi:hypothetical protein